MTEMKRLHVLNDRHQKRQGYILYWVQGTVRVSCNEALAFAVAQAEETALPLLVYYGVSDRYPEASYRHYHVLIEGVIELYENLKERNIRMVIARCSPEEGAILLAGRAALVITDGGYLRHERQWRAEVASKIDVPLIEIESNLIVPIRESSLKEEYSAATLRRKISPMIDYFASASEVGSYHGPYYSDSLPVDDLYEREAGALLSRTGIDRAVPPVHGVHGGYTHGRRKLEKFIESRLDGYGEHRNDPSLDYGSGLSLYLHYGFISPVEIYREVVKSGSPSAPDFIEQLVIRRHLAFNFVFYNPMYDAFEGLPDWAEKTLISHEKDSRAYLYSFEELERGETHDPYWNAAQKELKERGVIQNYMRMYWGKKILEWSSLPREAFRTALVLNNRYQLDGRDPNGYAGVAWCFGKHDRPWVERPVFGMVRYMNANGLERKFDMKGYLQKIEGNSLQEGLSL